MFFLDSVGSLALVYRVKVTTKCNSMVLASNRSVIYNSTRSLLLTKTYSFVPTKRNNFQSLINCPTKWKIAKTESIRSESCGYSICEFAWNNFGWRVISSTYRYREKWSLFVSCAQIGDEIITKYQSRKVRKCNNSTLSKIVLLHNFIMKVVVLHSFGKIFGNDFTLWLSITYQTRFALDEFSLLRSGNSSSW